jgi:hypothetical protein
MEPKSKKLTRFLCQELLYDYVTGKLSPQRHQAVEAYLKTCSDSRRELEKLNRGLRFVGQFEALKLSEELESSLLNTEPVWEKTLRAWTLWSSQRGWKLLPYFFVAIFAILAVFVYKPWKHKPHQEITLAEQLKKEPDMNPPEVKAPPPAKVETTTAAHAAASDSKVASASAPSAKAPPPAPVATTKTKPVASEPAKPAPTKEAKHKPGPQGFLTRADMDVSDFEHTWPIIRDKIVSLGGKAAGSVELGWLRRPDESYFHFSLPESNMKELEVFLKTFGPVRFNTYQHPRVMPPGQIRIILMVKDGNNHEGAAETP